MSDNYTLEGSGSSSSVFYNMLVKAGIVKSQTETSADNSSQTASEDELAVLVEDETEETASNYNENSSSNIGAEDKKILLLQENYNQELEKVQEKEQQLKKLNTKKNKYQTKLEQLANKNSEKAADYESKINGLEDKISAIQQVISGSFSKMTEINNKIVDALNETSSQSSNSISGDTTDEVSSTSNGTTSDTTNQTSNTSSGTTYTGTAISKTLASSLDSRLGAGFSAKCESVAASLNCNANDLLAMMYSESGLSSTITNSSSGSVGLIQFMPSTLTGNGYTTSEVANMTPVEQLDVVEDILLRSKTMAGYSQSDKLDAGSLYAITFLPAAAKNETLCAANGAYSWAYYSNSTADTTNKGSITKTDLANWITKKYNELLNDFV